MRLPRPMQIVLVVSLVLIGIGVVWARSAARPSKRASPPTASTTRETSQRTAAASKPETLPTKPSDSVSAPLGPGSAVGTRLSFAPTSKPGVSMEVEADRRAVLRQGDDTMHLRVTLRPDARGAATDGEGHGTDMVVVLDRSGSMSGKKIDYAKAALRQLIGRLHSRDRFALVAYEATASMLIPMQQASPDAKLSWLELVDRIPVRGSTNMAQGLDLANGMLEEAALPNRHGRVLLLSDGLANAGDFSLAGLSRRVRRVVRHDWTLTTMGIGTDFDEHLMTRLATAGDGAFYYLAKLEVLAQFFEAELATASNTVATRARLRLRPGPGVELVDAAGLDFERVDGALEIPIGSLYANRDRTLWLTLVVSTRGSPTVELGQLSLDYRDSDGLTTLPTAHLPQLATVEDPREMQQQVNRSVWESAMLDQELGQSQERLGDAIARGTEADIEQEVRRVGRHRELAEALGNDRVKKAILDFERSATLAKSAQHSAAEVRNLAAKRQKADGFIQRNRWRYPNVDPAIGY